MRRLAATLTLAILLTFPAARALAWNADYVDPQRLLADADLTDTSTMSKQDLQDLLDHGFLGRYRTRDIHGILRSATDIVWRSAQYFGINPRVIAVLLQREQSLIYAAHPTQDQLNWAMGFGVCDACDKTSPALAKYKGFGRQVYFASKKISENYLPDLQSKGETESGVGVGQPVTIDGVIVTPQTKATAVLYTYTPHLAGNANFVRIWNDWFTPDYPSGTLLQEPSGGVWLIRDGQRYPLASRMVLETSFPNRPIVPARGGVLNAYPAGPALAYPNYSLLRTPDGGVYLIVDDMVRIFATPALARQMGFDPSEINDVPDAVVRAYVQGPPILGAGAPPHAVLEQNAKTGGVYAVEDGVKHPIPAREVLAARFGAKPDIQAAAPDDLSALPDGSPVVFPDGMLVAAKGSAEIYVISNGFRRRIVDSRTLKAYGWRAGQVIQTSEKTLDLQPQGPDVLSPSETMTDLSTASAS